jgi:trigger factor
LNISIEKVDAINYVMTGIIDNSVIDEKVKELKAHTAQQQELENASDDQFEQAAAAKVFQAFIDAGVQQAGIPVETLLGQPGLKAYEKQEDSVKFVVDVATSPEINTDVDYMGAVPEYTRPVADPAAVEAKLSEFAASQAPMAPIATPRALQDGDTAIIDFTGYLDGEPFEGGTAKQFNLTIGSGAFIPGFEEQLVGMNYGETRTIDVTFPSNYQAEDLAGKTTQFEVTLHEIQERQTIEPDDAFAQKILGDETATLDTLKGKLADQVTAEALSELYNNELRPKLIKGLLERFDFPLPNNIVEQEIDAKIREKLQHVAPEEQAKLLEDKTQYLALRDAVRQEAANGIKIAMIVEALAEKEGVTADEQEVIAALSHHAMTTGQDAQAIVKYYQENNLMTSAKLSLTEDKLFGKMLGFDRA